MDRKGSDIRNIIIALALVPFVSCGGGIETNKQPNILIVAIDALRADHLGCYGYERNTTPNIDVFARDAIVYGNCYANCSWTKPSVTSLLTGSTCNDHEVQADFDVLPDNVSWLPTEYRERGYRTAGFFNAAYMLESKGYARGFDTFWHVFPSLEDKIKVLPKRAAHDLDDAVLVNRAIPWLRQTRGPWFCYVHFIGPHMPYERPERVYDFGAKKIDQYDAKLRYADKQVGRLLAVAPHDTIIVITADHGEEFGEHGDVGHGKTLYDEVVHVPLLIRWPGRKPKAEMNLVGLDRITSALIENRLPETGGTVRCDLEQRSFPDGNLEGHLKRVVTTADIEATTAPAIHPETVRQEQLKALGYF